MDKEIIRQTLLESFEVIKDSWKTREESISKAIVTMVAYDIDLALDMWYYVLVNNKPLLKTDANRLVKKILVDIADKYGYNDYGNDYPGASKFCRTIGSKILNNEDLCILLFRDSVNYGGCEYTDFCCMYLCYVPTLWIYSYLLTTDNIARIKKITSAILNNNNNNNYTSSRFLQDSVEILQKYYQTNRDGARVSIKESVKVALMEIVDSIQDPSERAEFVISILSFK